MSPKFSLQKPYVVAPLPRPIDHSDGRYVVGEVYGGAPGSKKRKRAELVVGVDGEGVNLYDIPSSRLVISYALPPQSSFSCPPCCLRTRFSKSKVERITYASTTGSDSQITLFKDSTNTAGVTQSSTVTRKVDQSEVPIVYMGLVVSTRIEDKNNSDLLVVKRDGEIQYLDGNTLEVRWTSPGSALGKDAATSTNSKVEFAHLTNAYSASQGILKGRQDVFALFPQEISENGFNPDILVIITTDITERNLHIVTLPRRLATHLNGLKHSVESLLVAKLPQSVNELSTESSFNINVSVGILQQLSGNVLTTFDLNDTLPKRQSEIVSIGAKSFLRLSSSSIMVASQTHINVYNPKFHSVLATVQLHDLNTPAQTEFFGRKRKSMYGEEQTMFKTCDLITYFPKLGAAVAITDNNLVAIQIEGQQGRQNKLNGVGLLIDSLGCSARDQIRAGREKLEPRSVGLTTMKTYLPGSIGNGEEAWAKEIKSAEKYFSNDDITSFEKAVCAHFGETWINEPKVNGAGSQGTTNGDNTSKRDPKSSDVDRRWILYALSKIFTWSKTGTDGYKLSVAFYPPNLFLWLMKTGNMTVANIESALREQIRSSLASSIPPGELVHALVEADRDMELLLAVLDQNFLGAAELLHAIRYLMDSLELFGENVSSKQHLLTNGEGSVTINGDVDEEVEILEKEAEEELRVAEYQLGAGSGIRGQALSLALSKLYTCPSTTIVNALQTTFTIQEIVCLIYLLRYELQRGAWTSRYLDTDELDIDEDGEIPDNSIILVTSLLSNCVDAIGAGGWLLGDARLVNGYQYDSGELIASLKFEVGAALEGIEEAAYLKGLTSEMVRFGEAVLKGRPAKKKAKNGSDKKPVILPSTEQNFTILPVGLKAEQQVSLLRVSVGGEITMRTSRDIGHLKSKKVGKYSLERIVI